MAPIPIRLAICRADINVAGSALFFLRLTMIEINAGFDCTFPHANVWRRQILLLGSRHGHDDLA
jgi:hypothetical protein